MNSKQINLLFCGHDFKFIKPFIVRCQKSALYNVRILKYEGHDIADIDRAKNDLKWAHVIYCEWALGNASWFSQKKRPDQILIVRLHSQEIHSRSNLNYIWEIDWQNVNHLITIAHHWYDWVCTHFPTISCRSSLIYNPIPAKGSLNKLKDLNARFVLGMVGIVPTSKRIDLAISILRDLMQCNRKYRLRVKGAMPSEYKWMNQRSAEMNWYEQILGDIKDLTKSGNLILDPQGPQMEEWYENIGHVLSVSDFEGSHQAVAEAMAAGSIPVIRNWVGASRIYPDRYVRNTIGEMVELIKQNTAADRFENESEFCRSFSQNRFDEKKICDSIEAVIHRELMDNSKSPVRSLCSIKLKKGLPTFFIIAYVPIGSRNGYRIRVEQQVSILKRCGCKVHLVCFVPMKNFKPNATQTVEHAREFQALGCNVHIIPVEGFFGFDDDFRRCLSVLGKLGDIVKSASADVIHAEAIYCARIGAEIKREIPGIIFSIDWHGISPEEARMSDAHQNRVNALENLERTLLQTSDLNIFVSRQMEKHFSNKYGLERLKYAVIPCCASDDFLEAKDTVEIPGISNRHFVFGYVGSMAEWQCGSEMIWLFSRLYQADHGCRFVCLIPESDQEKLQSFIKNEGLPEHSIFVTEAPHKDIPRWMRAFHIGVLLRKKGPVNIVASPTKYAEYLSAGVPVLMTDCVGDYSEHVMRHHAGFVLPEPIIQDKIVSQDDLIAILEMAERSRQHRGEVARNCRNAVFELGWESAADQWIDAYKAFY